MNRLHVARWGTRGPAVVLVHGSVLDGSLTWAAQKPLGERWRVLVPDRPGFGGSGEVDRVDFEVDGRLVAGLLPAGGAHLAGHSYGGVVSLVAAALRPDAVRSLCLVEPPAFSVARGNPDVERLVARFERLWADPPEDDVSFLHAFLAAVGSKPAPGRPSEAVVRGARVLRGERMPWEADLDLDALAAARFPKLVVSGGHSPAFEATCDVLAEGLGAERAVVAGAGHSIPRVGAPLNERLETFWHAAESGREDS